MSDNLVIGGATFSNVAGIKVTDTADNVVTFMNGGYTAADFADQTKPVGRFVSYADYIGKKNNSGAQPYLSGRTEITSIYMPNYNNTANASAGPFRDNTKMKYAVLPKMTVVYNAAFYNCPVLEAIDWLGGSVTGSTYQFTNCPKLNVMVIRKTNGVCSLANIKAFNDTPFASGKAGGTLYVPQDLIASYQSATNWSTILGYTNNQIKSIESTHTDPDAPIDLTLYYADGTPIPTT